MTAVAYFFTPLALLVMSEHCHDEFFVKFNFLDVPCLKMVISKGLGYGIIAGSILVKVPQIIKLVKANSGEGVSIPSLFTEMTALTFTMAYSVHKQFPFSSWGEALFMSIQNLMLVSLIFYYGKNYVGTLLFAPCFVGITYVLCSPYTPANVVTKLQEFTLIISAVSKFLQVWANFSNGHTGQLSFITIALLSGGSLARVFTSVQETGDVLVIAQFLIACSLNFLILGQMVWYWNVSGEKKKSE